MHGLAVPLSGRAGHRGQTGAACHLFAVEGADFGVRVARMALRWKVVRPERPQRKRRAGISTAAALTAPGPGLGRMISKARAWGFSAPMRASDFGVNGAQLPSDQGQAGAALLDHKAGLPGLDAGQKSGLILDRSLAGEPQFLEFAPGFRYWRLWSQVQRRPHLELCNRASTASVLARGPVDWANRRACSGFTLISDSSAPKRRSRAAWQDPVAT